MAAHGRGLQLMSSEEKAEQPKPAQGLPLPKQPATDCKTFSILLMCSVLTLSLESLRGPDLVQGLLQAPATLRLGTTAALALCQDVAASCESVEGLLCKLMSLPLQLSCCEAKPTA